MRLRKIGFMIVVVLILSNVGMSIANASSIIVFKDSNLYNALCKYFNYEGDFTNEKAEELSKNKMMIVLENTMITDLEGLQYFVGLKTAYIGGNNLNNLKQLSQLPDLGMLHISNNSIKGNAFDKALNSMGRIEKLHDLNLDNDGLTSIKFLNKIGHINNYTVLSMQDNKVSDLSILKDATELDTLSMANNRITDVSPLKNLGKLTWCIDLRDNCIIDYKPIKHLFDKMYDDFDTENGMDRYDFYTNPVNFKYNGKKIDFPYLTVYYKYQAYAEAAPLFKTLGGRAVYDKKSGQLTCKYDGDILVFKDFSKKYTINGEVKSLKYPMRRMQYDLAYVPVENICEVLGLKYKVTKTRPFYLGNDEYEYAPKLVEISKPEKKLG